MFCSEGQTFIVKVAFTRCLERQRDVFIKGYAENRGHTVGDERSEVTLKVSAFRSCDHSPASGGDVIAGYVGEKTRIYQLSFLESNGKCNLDFFKLSVK